MNDNGAFSQQQEEADVSWTASSKDGQDEGADRPKKGKGDVLLESMLFKDDAKEIGVVEVSRKWSSSSGKTGHATRDTQGGCNAHTRARYTREQSFVACYPPGDPVV